MRGELPSVHATQDVRDYDSAAREIRQSGIAPSSTRGGGEQQQQQQALPRVCLVHSGALEHRHWRVQGEAGSIPPRQLHAEEKQGQRGGGLLQLLREQEPS